MLNQFSIKSKAGFTNYFHNAHGSSLALTLSELALQQDSLLVVMLPDASQAMSLSKEVEFFLGDKSELPVIILPDWETLPYDYFSPHQDIISERLRTLYQLPNLNKGILLLPVTSAVQKLTNKSYIQQHCLSLELQQKLDTQVFVTQLVEAGYTNVSKVIEHGEYAVRGSIIDLFPMGTDFPVRVELFDDEIESIRLFDCDSQLTTKKIEQFNLLPAKEYPTNEKAIAQFRQSWRSKFDTNIKDSPIYKDVSNGVFPAGIEYYLPLFFESLSHIFDYLESKDSLILVTEDIDKAIESFWHDLNERYEQHRHDLERPILSPSELYLSKQELRSRIKDYAQIEISHHTETKSKSSTSLNYSACENVSVEHKSKEPLNNFIRAVDQDYKILICAESPGRQEVIRELMTKNQVSLSICNNWNEYLTSPESISLTVAPLSRGFKWKNHLIVCESDLFGKQVLQRKHLDTKALSPDQLIHSLAELKIGDPVVHIEQGIGAGATSRMRRRRSAAERRQWR